MANKIWLGNDSGNEGDLDVADNWSPSGVPGSATEDAVFFQDSSQSVTANLDALNGTAEGISSVTIAQSFTGNIGLDADNAQTYMELDAPVVNIGIHSGPGSPSGSGRMLIELTDDASAQTVNVRNTGISNMSYKPALRIKTAVEDHALNIREGSVGVAVEVGETAKFATVNIAGGANVVIGSGTTLAALTKRAGTAEIVCAATTVTNSGGRLTISGGGAVATLNCNGGEVLANSTGTITTLNVNGGHCDLTGSMAARTITTLNVNGTGRFSYDKNVVTITNAIASTGNLEIRAK